jgi:hypothetical protein
MSVDTMRIDLSTPSIQRIARGALSLKGLIGGLGVLAALMLLALALTAASALLLALAAVAAGLGLAACWLPGVASSVLCHRGVYARACARTRARHAARREAAAASVQAAALPARRNHVTGMVARARATLRARRVVHLALAPRQLNRQVH